MTFREALRATGLGPDASVHDLEIALRWAVADYQVRARLTPAGAVRSAYLDHLAYLEATLASLRQHGRKVRPHERPGYEGPWPDEAVRKEPAALPEEQVRLALLQQLGQGVAQDFAAAARLYRAAAAQGYAPGQRGLADLYADGAGILEDARTYLELDWHMARHGEDWARYLMGRRYESGWGVSKDIHEATWWYRLGWEAGEFVHNLSALERLGDYRDGRPKIGY